MSAVASFHLEYAGIDVRKPLGLVGMVLQIEPRDKGFVSADNDHDEEVGDHDHIDEPQHCQHNVGFGDGGRLLDEMPELDKKVINVNALRNDEPEIERRLEPPAQKDEVAERMPTFRRVKLRCHSRNNCVGHLK